MSLVINSNDPRSPLFNNEFLEYYRDFDNYLFLPDRSITAAANSTPETNSSAFSINGTVVNSLCQKILATSTVSTSVNIVLNCPQQAASALTNVTNIFSGKVRLGDFYSCYGGESFSSVEFLGTCVFNAISPRIFRYSDCSLLVKIGFLHQDGTITYFVDKEIRKTDSSLTTYTSFNVGSGEMFYFVCDENEALPGDKIVIEFQGKINMVQVLPTTGQTVFDSNFTLDFGTNQPFIQLNF